MAERQFHPKGYNYPAAVAVNASYRDPPPLSNPVVRGLPLHYLASLISSSGILQSLLWRNAGFAVIRGRKEADGVECRYDPTVIPSPGPDTAPAPKSTDPSGLRPPARDLTGRYYSVVDFHEGYKSGQFTPTAIVEALLPLIRRDVEAPTEHATAFVETHVDLVSKAAEASTLRYKEGKPLGVLDGVPVAVKDQADIKGYMTRCGMTREFKEKPQTTSWCISKWEEEGAIILGKLSMHELGKGITSNNIHYGTPLNPHNEHYYPGGSSGGSSYAVGAGLIPIAHGADGGGSIRIPSSFCGIYGLKPSHGRVSARPTSNVGITTTVHGPLASNMVDLEVAYRVMAAPDPRHPVSSLFSGPRPHTGSREKLLGIYQPWFDRADVPVQRTCQNAIDFLVSAQGYRVVPITIPMVHEGQMAHAMTILNETATAWPDVSTLAPDNKVLVSVATKTPATDFVRAQKIRNLLMQHLAHLFAEHPGLMIVMPTTPNAGCHISGGKSELRYGVNDANNTIRTMEFVWLANFTGIPAITVPVGYVDPVEGEGQIPVGLMAMGEWGTEDALIEWGYDGEAYLNGALEGGRRRPKTFVDVLELVRKQDDVGHAR